MLEFPSFVCNEHTCLLPAKAIFRSRLPTRFDFGLGLLDFGLFVGKSFSFIDR